VLIDPEKIDLLDWQILWIGENVPKGAMIGSLFRLYRDDLNMEVGIEIMYEHEGQTFQQLGLLH